VIFDEGSADLVVIDAPPHAETEARIAVRAARLVVVPVQPSPLDLWATAETLKMAQDERRRSLVVQNRVPPRSRLTEDIAADLAGAGTPSRRPGSATVLHWRKRWRWGLASSKTPV
jgi:chromosome partitioning protein